MNRIPLTTAMAAMSVVLAITAAPANEWKSQSLATKRQLVSQVIECMKKRMSSDRLISYNDAAKVCKAEVKRQVESASSGPLVAADSPAK
jgi:hypothetical protein